MLLVYPLVFSLLLDELVPEATICCLNQNFLHRNHVSNAIFFLLLAQNW
jgi:hypothetical protein